MLAKIFCMPDLLPAPPVRLDIALDFPIEETLLLSDINELSLPGECDRSSMQVFMRPLPQKRCGLSYGETPSSLTSSDRFSFSIISRGTLY